MDELRKRLEELRGMILELANKDTVTPEEDQNLEDYLAERAVILETIEKREAREAAVAEVRAAEVATTPGFDEGPQIMRRVDPVVDVRTASKAEARDASLKVLEREGGDLSSRQIDNVERLIRHRSLNSDGDRIARRLLLTESDAYRSAFAKGITQSSPAFTSEEVAALNEFRAMSIGTDSAGGYGVPVLIDPTIILTSGAADAPILQIARIETITTDEWKGVSSDGMSWSFDGEATEVSDDSPTLVQPTVPVYKAQGFIPYSIEVGQDYPGFADEMRMLLDQGYVDLVASQSMTGTGSAPQGIFTALDGNTNVEVVVTTDGSFGVEDIRKVWGALPERSRARATWLMHTDVANEVDSFGSNDAGFTTTLAEANVRQIKGRPVVLSDYAPEFTGTTGAANILVVGDFSGYLVAQRAGMTVELVSHLFATANNRPNGQRGWYAYARVGMDSIADNYFRLLQNQ